MVHLQSSFAPQDAADSSIARPPQQDSSPARLQPVHWQLVLGAATKPGMTTHGSAYEGVWVQVSTGSVSAVAIEGGDGFGRRGSRTPANPPPPLPAWPPSRARRPSIRTETTTTTSGSASKSHDRNRLITPPVWPALPGAGWRAVARSCNGTTSGGAGRRLPPELPGALGRVRRRPTQVRLLGSMLTPTAVAPPSCRWAAG
jgi:hypothetical protein